MESPYWVTKEVQAYFNVSRQTIDRWRKPPLGFPEPVHNVGHPRGPCRYLKAEVLAWDEARRERRTTRPRAPENEGAHLGR
jgi:predicted DNA-binding transcriptional regulator AlpA